MSILNYPSGQQRWNGHFAYHPDGKVAWNGTHAYFASGNLAWNGAFVYYDSGQVAWNGTYSYHPDGKVELTKADAKGMNLGNGLSILAQGKRAQLSIDGRRVA